MPVVTTTITTSSTAVLGTAAGSELRRLLFLLIPAVVLSAGYVLGSRALTALARRAYRRLPVTAPLRRRRTARRPSSVLRDRMHERAVRLRWLGSVLAFITFVLLGAHAGLIGYDQTVRWVGGCLGGGLALVVTDRYVFSHWMPRIRISVDAGRPAPVRHLQRWWGFGSGWCRRRLRRLRFGRRTGDALSLVPLALLGLGGGGIAPSAGQVPAQAVPPVACDATVAVIDVDGVSTSQRRLGEETSADDPFVVQPEQIDRLNVVWTIDQPVKGRAWSLETNAFGHWFVVGTGVAGDSTGGAVDRTFYADVLSGVVPGLHQVRAKVWSDDGVGRTLLCDTTGFVHLRCPGLSLASLSPVRVFRQLGGNASTRFCTLALLGWLGTFCLVVRSVVNGGTAWGSRGRSGLSFELFEGATSADLVRGVPPPRQDPYILRTRLALPESSGGPGGRWYEMTLDQSGSAAETKALGAEDLTGNLRLRVPGRQALRAQLDLRWHGRLVRSVDLTRIDRRWRRPDGLARLAARITFDAGYPIHGRQRELTEADASILVKRIAPDHRGRAARSGMAQIMLWRSPEVVLRRRVDLNVLGLQVERYRLALTDVLTEAERNRPFDEQLGILARAGNRMAREIFGQSTFPLPDDLKLEVVELGGQIPDGVDLSIPWTALYWAPTAVASRLCPNFASVDARCDQPGCSVDEVLCPNRFGAVRDTVIASRAAARVRRNVWRTAVSWSNVVGRDPFPDDTTRPLRILEVVHREDEQLHRSSSQNRVEGDTTTVHGCDDADTLWAFLASRLPDADFLHVIGHGTEDGQAIRLGRRVVLDSTATRRLARRRLLARRPIVVLNACQTGLMSLHRNTSILANLGASGAGAVLVTLVPVSSQAAVRAATAMVESFRSANGRLDPIDLRRLVADGIRHRRDLSLLAYQYYEFQRRYDRPAIDVTDRPIQREVIYVD